MKVDFIRLYQDEDDPSHTLGCSPEKYPTAQFIRDYPERYADWVPLQPSSETKQFGIFLMISVVGYRCNFFHWCLDTHFDHFILSFLVEYLLSCQVFAVFSQDRFVSSVFFSISIFCFSFTRFLSLLNSSSSHSSHSSFAYSLSS